MASPGVLTAIFVANLLVLLVYRVSRSSTPGRSPASSTPARCRRRRAARAAPRMPGSPLSIAGLVAVILVIAARPRRRRPLRRAWPIDLVNCVFGEDGTASLRTTRPTADARELGAPASTDGRAVGRARSQSPSPRSPRRSRPHRARWPPPCRRGTARSGSTSCSIGVGRRGRRDGASFNTDTLIVVSIDPATKQVAMFQVPRDMVDVPVPDNARSLWGSVYAGKINSWYNQNRNRTDLWPGNSAQTRGFNSLKAILGELYGLDIRYYVKVDFEGFREVVDTRRRRDQVNVQMPGLREPVPRRARAPHAHLHPGRPAAHDRRARRSCTHGPATGRAAGLRPRARASSASCSRSGADERPGDHRQPADQLIKDIGKSRQDRHPRLGAAQAARARRGRGHQEHPLLRVLPALLRARSAGQLDPAATSSRRNVDRIRKAVKEAFSVSPEPRPPTATGWARRRRPVWVLNASGRGGPGDAAADYLAYHGLEASAPNQRSRQAPPPRRRIVVYNGAETEMPETIKYLETLYGVTGDHGHRPGDARGHRRHAPGRARRQDGRRRRLT